jgi:hypothetical protein
MTQNLFSNLFSLCHKLLSVKKLSNVTAILNLLNKKKCCYLHGKYKAAKYFNLNASMIGHWILASESWIIFLLIKMIKMITKNSFAIIFYFVNSILTNNNNKLLQYSKVAYFRSIYKL